MYDVLIVGGGPIGLTCGIEAIKSGLSYTIIEKGCLVNSIFNYPINMTFFSTSVKIEIGDVPFVSITPKPTRQEALEYYRRVKDHWNLNIKTYETVEEVIREKTYYTIQTSKGVYQAKNVIIATGFYDIPNYLGVEGEDLPKVKHYYDDPHPYMGQNIVVVGAGNSAADVALETWRKGANVTMVVRKPHIKPSIKYWIKPDIENRIKEGSIKAYFNSTVEAIRPSEIDIQTPEGKQTLPNDFVLAMTGYQPNFKWLEKVGIEFTKDTKRLPIYNEETFETTVPNIYLAGVVCGGMITNKWFIENARFHAGNIMRSIKEKEQLVVG